MRIDALSAALSGIHAASRRLGVSAHNTANLLTEDFQPLRATQSARATGGVDVAVTRSDTPQPVNLASELVEQSLASVAARASIRVLDTDLDMLGQLLDIDA